MIEQSRERLGRWPTFKDAYETVNHRAPGFDTVRICAASAVVLHHSLLAYYPLSHDILYRWSSHRTQFGFLAVCVFFVLSGFLVTPGLVKSGDVIDYISRRFVRIMPLLILVVTVTALLVGPFLTKLSFWDYFTEPATWRYLKNITTSLSLALPGVDNGRGRPDVNGALWSLRYEWLCYLFLAGSLLVGVLRRRIIFLLLYLAAVALAMVWHEVAPNAAESTPMMLLRLWTYFASGTLIFLFRDSIRYKAALSWAAITAFLLVARTPIFDFVGPFLLAYFVMSAGLIRWPWRRVLERADLSYGIYLTHAVILAIVLNLVRPGNPLLLFAIVLPIACLVAMCTWFAVEKPALHYKLLPSVIVKQILRRASVRVESARRVRSEPRS